MKLYYFSATGNSLTTARRLAAQLGDCTLVPVAAVKDKSKIMENDDAVGFVFPVYYGNMPYPVREMIGKMVFRPETYVFIVTTQRGHAGAVAGRMDQLLKTRGQKLSLALSVLMPGNSFINPPEVDRKYLEQQDENVAALLKPIREREAHDYAEAGCLPQTPIDYPNNFRGIEAEDRCIGCGTCVKVCPMNNIVIRDDKAVIGDDCSSCLACFHWCPVKAIWMSRQENIARRDVYRHPEVTVKDIAEQKGACGAGKFGCAEVN